MATETTLQQLQLNFYDVQATIHSDSSAYIDLFAKMYPRFISKSVANSPQHTTEFTVYTTPNNPAKTPILITERQKIPLNKPDFLEGFVYEAILNDIISRVQSHLLIHAGVVSHHNQGIIIAADSGHGKTTLVLELLRRGCKFLSDEIAAISRTDQQVYSFPRSLRIRSGTLDLVGFSEAQSAASTWLDKLLLDVEAIQPNCLADVAPIRQVILLHNPHNRIKNSNQTLDIFLERLDDTLIEQIYQMTDIIKLDIDTDGVYPMLKILADNRMAVLEEIEKLCHEHQILIVNVIRRRYDRPTFVGPAKLEKIPTSKAALELLKQFKPGHHSALLKDEFHGRSKLLFIELMSLLGQATCYRLSVGPLNQMADLVGQLVELPPA